ncbi:MAG: PBSX family phage terminase large subunit [Flavobacterium sp.]
MRIPKFFPKQERSIKESNAFLNVWVGAVRSGKTHASIFRFGHYIMNAPPGELCILGKSMGSIKRNILAPMAEMFGNVFTYSIGKGEAILFNRKIHLIGANDERAEHKIRGPSFAGAYVDEVTIIPQGVFQMLVSRLSVPGAKLFATTNPDSPFHWFKVEFLDRASDWNLTCFDFLLDDNVYLEPSYVKTIKSGYRGLWYDRYVLGKWVLAEGTIFDFFDEKTHTIEFAPGNASYYVVGVDYGTTNPCAFSLIGYSDKTYPNRWLEKEYYYDSKAMMRQKTDTEYADDFIKFTQGYRINSVYVDPSAASFKLELMRRGIDIVKDADNEVLDGIRFHSNLLSNGGFKVLKSCKNAIKEYGTYRWDAKAANRGVDQPIKENDHVLDSIRYALYSHWYQADKALSVDEYRAMQNPNALNHGKFFENRMW